MDEPTRRQTEDKIQAALEAWHADRLEWADRALRSLSIVNAGGAVAAAALLGSALSQNRPLVSALPSLIFFVTGLVLNLIYANYRFLWAEYRISYLRRWRGKVRDYRKHLAELDANPRIKTQHPPTRPQLWLTYILNIASLLSFCAGLVFGIWAILSIVS